MTKDMFSQMKKNNVKAEGQMGGYSEISYINKDGTGLKVLFVGNSITLHNIKPEIGWNMLCGMAASAPDKDYVHLVSAEVSKIDSKASFCICQAAKWEREFCFDYFEEARDFDADIIVLRLIENCSSDNFDGEVFKSEYMKFLRYLNLSGKSKFILTSGFWRHPGDKVIEEVAKELGCAFVPLGDLGENDEMKAIGLFEHKGVANHPGDKGMKKIAERIFNEIKNLM